jgi:hypothetical protein
MSGDMRTGKDEQGGGAAVVVIEGEDLAAKGAVFVEQSRERERAEGREPA